MAADERIHRMHRGRWALEELLDIFADVNHEMKASLLRRCRIRGLICRAPLPSIAQHAQLVQNLERLDALRRQLRDGPQALGDARDATPALLASLLECLLLLIPHVAHSAERDEHAASLGPAPA
jgi:hypothetical protein